MDFDREAYLRRVGIDGDAAATEAGLETLHRAQTFAIPFENFDIHLGRGVSLDPGALFDKLVNRRRGGYCFELNSLFGLALDAFGFARRPLLARVHVRSPPTSRTHLLNLVRLNGRKWIADPGFGVIQPHGPIPLERDRVENQGGMAFRLSDGGDFGTMLQYLEDGVWRNLYSFDMEHVWPVDIEMGNHFTSTHPSAFFTRARVAIRTDPSGRTTLMDFLLRRHGAGETRETVLAPGPGYVAAVAATFGIVLDAPYEALRPVGDEAAGA